jgi:hypothetical protein
MGAKLYRAITGEQIVLANSREIPVSSGVQLFNMGESRERHRDGF